MSASSRSLGRARTGPLVWSELARDSGFLDTSSALSLRARPTTRDVAQQVEPAEEQEVRQTSLHPPKHAPATMFATRMSDAEVERLWRMVEQT